MTNWQSIESEYYLHVVNRQPIVLVKGEGTRVWDIDGKEYLDFTSGWAVTNIGHANPVLADAIADQARTLIQTSNQFMIMSIGDIHFIQDLSYYIKMRTVIF